MVTILVATQIIRITQNAIQLHRQNIAFNKNLKWFDDNEITERDFKTQREAFQLLKYYLEKQICEEVE